MLSHAWLRRYAMRGARQTRYAEKGRDYLARLESGVNLRHQRHGAVWISRSRWYIHRNNYRLAIHALSRAIRLDKACLQKGLLWRAWCYTQNGQADRAKSDLSRLDDSYAEPDFFTGNTMTKARMLRMIEPGGHFEGGRFGAEFSAQWLPASKVLVTRLRGLFSMDDVRAWGSLLTSETEKIPPGTDFKFFADEFGYQWYDTRVHQCKRDVMPGLLARFGFVLSLLPENQRQILCSQTDMDPEGRQCIAVVINHHDKATMAQLQKQFGGCHEKYLSDGAWAKQWIEAYKEPIRINDA